MAVEEETPLLKVKDEAALAAAPSEISTSSTTRRHVNFFSKICHYFGHWSLRAFSNLLMLVSLVFFEILQVFAYYDVGVLNWWPYIVNIAAFPGVIAIGILKECFLRQGVLPNRLRPPNSVPLILAWVLMGVSFLICMAIPIDLRGKGLLTDAWMWYSILGTGALYLSFLFAYLFEGVATKLKLSVEDDGELV